MKPAIVVAMAWKYIRNAFISGLLLLAPVGVTLWVLNLLIKSLGGPAQRWFFFFVDEEFRQNPLVEPTLTLLSAILVLLLITLLGWFSTLLIGRFVLARIEKLLTNVPLVRNVYTTVKQIIETFSKNQRAVFQKTVLIEYPRKGVYALGFLTGDGRGEVQYKTESDVINVFVPTTPNPTSGFLLMVPREEVIELDMSIADGMKVIISGGAVVPDYGSAPTVSVPTPLPEGDAKLQRNDATQSA